MRRALLLSCAALLIAGCKENTPGPEEAPTEEIVVPEISPEPPFNMDLPGPTDDNPQLLVDYWKGAVEAEDGDAARRAWRAEVRSGGNAPRWSNLSGITVTVGEGQQEGAAGSLYYSVPVNVAGTNIDHGTTHLSGTMTLRRVNGVPGATSDQLSWRIESIDWDS